jgi:hypothetical protein
MSDFIVTADSKKLSLWANRGAGVVPRLEFLEEMELTGDLTSDAGITAIKDLLPEIKEKKGKFPLPFNVPWQKDNGGKSHTVSLIMPSFDLFMRLIDLPFEDLQKARLAAPSVLSGSLPFEGDIFSDLIPLKADGEEGKTRYMAIAVNVSEVEPLISAVEDTGLTCSQVVPAPLLLLSYIESEGGVKGGEYRDQAVRVKAPSDWRVNGLVRLLPPLSGEAEGDDYLSAELASIHLEEKVERSGDEGIHHFYGIDEGIISPFFSNPLLSGFNLIAGKVIREEELLEGKRKRYLITASILLAAFSLIFTLEGTSYFTGKKASAVKRELSREFGRMFKGATMVDPIAQIKDKIKSLETEIGLFPPPGSSISSLITLISSRVRKEDSIKISSLDYARGKLTLVGEAPGQKELNGLKSSLLEGTGLTVDVIETGPAAVEGRIKFTISIM